MDPATRAPQEVKILRDNLPWVMRTQRFLAKVRNVGAQC